MSSSGRASKESSIRATPSAMAFSAGLIADGQGWMQMLTDRNRTSHTYNEETAEAILLNIRQQHHPLLKALERVLSNRAEPNA
ncbi:hypothetical protein ACG10_01195 [Azotobacter chroococcum]|nr:hypothetical protein ACG10_01195 [Azotobacter chroococcum]